MKLYFYILAVVFLSSCSANKMVDSIEPQTDVVFPYSQKFVAHYKATGTGDSYQSTYRKDSAVTKILGKGLTIEFTGNENFGISDSMSDDKGKSSIYWSSEMVDSYTDNGTVTMVTFFYGDGNWVKYWKN